MPLPRITAFHYKQSEVGKFSRLGWALKGADAEGRKRDIRRPHEHHLPRVQTASSPQMGEFPSANGSWNSTPGLTGSATENDFCDSQEEVAQRGSGSVTPSRALSNPLPQRTRGLRCSISGLDQDVRVRGGRADFERFSGPGRVPPGSHGGWMTHVISTACILCILPWNHAKLPSPLCFSQAQDLASGGENGVGARLGTILACTTAAAASARHQPMWKFSPCHPCLRACR